MGWLPEKSSLAYTRHNVSDVVESFSMCGDGCAVQLGNIGREAGEGAESTQQRVKQHGKSALNGNLTLQEKYM